MLLVSGCWLFVDLEKWQPELNNQIFN